MADWDRRRDERDRYDRGRDEGREWHRPQPGGDSRDEREFARGDEGFQRGYRRHGGSFEAGAGGDFGTQGQRNRGWDEDRGRSFDRDPYGGNRGRGDRERDRAGFRDDLGRERGRDFGSDWAEEGYGQGFVGNEGRGFGSGRDYENERRVTGGSGGRGERGWWDRASDEVASWFGDEDADRRRQQDHRGRGPRGYTRSDERIKEDVSDRLADDRWVDASEIDVTVNASEVTLSGTVESREARRRAEDIVERVSGVSYVQNNLRVGRMQPPTGSGDGRPAQRGCRQHGSGNGHAPGQHGCRYVGRKRQLGCRSRIRAEPPDAVQLRLGARRRPGVSWGAVPVSANRAALLPTRRRAQRTSERFGRGITSSRKITFGFFGMAVAGGRELGQRRRLASGAGAGGTRPQRGERYHRGRRRGGGDEAQAAPDARGFRPEAPRDRLRCREGRARRWPDRGRARLQAGAQALGQGQQLLVRAGAGTVGTDPQALAESLVVVAAEAHGRRQLLAEGRERARNSSIPCSIPITRLGTTSTSGASYGRSPRNLATCCIIRRVAAISSSLGAQGMRIIELIRSVTARVGANPAGKSTKMTSCPCRCPRSSVIQAPMPSGCGRGR